MASSTTKTAILGIVVVSVVGALGILLGGVGWTLLTDDVPAPVQRAEPPASADPLRPHIGLAFSGDCSPDFEQTVSVQTTPNGNLRMISRLGEQERALFAIYPHGDVPVQGRIELNQPYWDSTHNQIQLHDGSSGWWGNYHTDVGGMPPTVIGGFVQVDRFEPLRGLVDLTFENVTLQNWETGTLCHIDGRLETFGLTWGHP